MIERELVAYLLKECNGLHMFHISRIIALLDMEFLKREGRKITSLDYQKTPYGFTSNRLAETVKSLPVEKVQAQPYGYLVLKEDVEVNLPENVLSILNEILDEVCQLSDGELNKKVMENPFYEKL